MVLAETNYVQYNKEPNVSTNNSSSEQVAGGTTNKVNLQVRPDLTVDMVEVQYAQDEKTVKFLISKGGENGIETTGEVKKEIIKGTTVYFANGIVIWEDITDLQ